MAELGSNGVWGACLRGIDPLGLARGNLEAVGRWRARAEDGAALDVWGSMPGGDTFEGVAGLRQALLARPEIFAGTLTEKLLTFALGRGVDYNDAPAVRKVIGDASRGNYRFSAIVSGIVRSAPFQMRRAVERPEGASAAAAR